MVSCISETLLVVAGLGIQTTATFYLGKQHTRFIPWGNIIDIVIAETITMVSWTPQSSSFPNITLCLMNNPCTVQYRYNDILTLDRFIKHNLTWLHKKTGRVN